MKPTTTHEEVSAYYAALQASDDLKTNAACCATTLPPKYVRDVLPQIADEVAERFYGCGSPIPPALEGKTVLDLGCGTGRDAYVLSKLVGEHGRVIGIDMTASQLDIARKYQDEQRARFGFATSNVDFREGYIEDLASCGIESESIDLVVSNCVINLSPFKDRVFAEIYRVLKDGGEFFFSDVYSSRRLPDAWRNDPILRGECLGGALYPEDFKRKMEDAGWPHFVIVDTDDIHVSDFALMTKTGFTGFTSSTVRAIKCSGLEQTEEDYGQIATYNGGMPEMPRYFDFDEQTRFIKGKPKAISRNTARMVAASRYGQFFSLTPEGEHRGAFDATRAQAALAVRSGTRPIDCAFLQDAYDHQGYIPFAERVGQPTLLRTLDHQHVMQTNITYACNLACRHCYLECSPKNTERMTRETLEKCLAAFDAGNFTTMDITGGSPELHPDFSWFVQESAKRGEVIVRTNLTLLTHPHFASLIDEFAHAKVRIVGSLPFYNDNGTDSQRGAGVFKRAIDAVRALNQRGYGTDSTLVLDLVYNVSGPYLPLPQDMIEEAYKTVLERSYQVHFNSLLAFNNFPLGRFAQDLMDAGTFNDYLALLADNFNALAVSRMMCRDMINVDVDGRLYDCEVNHVLGLPIQTKGRDATIDDLLSGQLPARTVRTHPVCYSCAAGFGSSCGGSLLSA